jgi:hypothetical protein
MGHGGIKLFTFYRSIFRDASSDMLYLSLSVMWINGGNNGGGGMLWVSSLGRQRLGDSKGGVESENTELFNTIKSAQR